MSNITDNSFSFERLEVYQRALHFATELCQMGVEFPHVYSRLRDQLVGAVISVPLNIAEGSGRLGGKDKANFYKYARASVFESIPILTICNNLKLIKTEDVVRYKGEA